MKHAQRDVLAAVSYSLGDSPQPILDELWQALPSLRQLLTPVGYWNVVQRETWLKLFEAVSGEPFLVF